MMADVADRDAPPKIAFGAWLLQQVKRDDHVGELARAAARDPLFPRDGDAEAVGKRMQSKGADADAWAAIEDAETDWLCI